MLVCRCLKLACGVINNYEKRFNDERIVCEGWRRRKAAEGPMAIPFERADPIPMPTLTEKAVRKKFPIDFKGVKKPGSMTLTMVNGEVGVVFGVVALRNA